MRKFQQELPINLVEALKSQPQLSFETQNSGKLSFNNKVGTTTYQCGFDTAASSVQSQRSAPSATHSSRGYPQILHSSSTHATSGAGASHNSRLFQPPSTDTARNREVREVSHSNISASTNNPGG